MGLDDVMFVPHVDNSDLPEELKKLISFDATKEKKGINIDNLLNLVQQGYFSDLSIHEVLEKCELHLCSTPSAPRNPELEDRITKLKAEQANEEYRSMTKSIFPQEGSRISFKKEVNSVASQVTAVINFVFAVVGSFFFAYKAVEYALPYQNIPAQVLMGLFTSIAVALADLYFLARTI